MDEIKRALSEALKACEDFEAAKANRDAKLLAVSKILTEAAVIHAAVQPTKPE